MDDILVRNIRGVNSPNKQEDIKIFLHKQKVGLLALLETKVKEENIDKVANNLFGGWRWITNVARVPKVKIWVAWQTKVYTIRVVTTTDQLIHCQACQLATQKTFHITLCTSKIVTG